MSAEIRKKIAINYGLLFGGVSVLIGVLQYLLIDDYNIAIRESQNTALGFVQLALLAVFPLIALYQARNKQGGFITFKEAFKLAFTVIIYATLIGIIWVLLFTMVLEPDYVEPAREAAYEQMIEANPDMTDAQLDQAVSMMENFTSPWMIAIFAILMNALFGVIIGLIGGAIFKRNPPVSSEL